LPLCGAQGKISSERKILLQKIIRGMTSGQGRRKPAKKTDCGFLVIHALRIAERFHQIVGKALALFLKCSIGMAAL